MTTVSIYGTKYQYDPSDKSLKVGTFSFNEQDYQRLSEEYKGANRIHKPCALLFWTDCRNGKASNWTTQKQYNHD